MRQYRFTDTNQDVIYDKPRVKLILDGECIDDRIKEFSTLNVTGREMMGRDLITTSYSSISAGGKTGYSRNFRDSGIGNKFLSSSVPSRTLNVEFSLIADNDRRYRQVWERLNYYVNKEEMEIIFTDDSDFYYTGTLTSVSETGGNSNGSIATMGFECTDPFKYMRVSQDWEFEGKDSFKQYSMYPVDLNHATISGVSGDRVSLTNKTKSQNIIIYDNFKVSDRVKIDFKENRIYKNNVDITEKLYLLSNLEDFIIDMGDVLTTSPSGKVLINYTRRVL